MDSRGWKIHEPGSDLLPSEEPEHLVMVIRRASTRPDVRSAPCEPTASTTCSPRIDAQRADGALTVPRPRSATRQIYRAGLVADRRQPRTVPSGGNPAAGTEGTADDQEVAPEANGQAHRRRTPAHRRTGCRSRRVGSHTATLPHPPRRIRAAGWVPLPGGVLLPLTRGRAGPRQAALRAVIVPYVRKTSSGHAVGCSDGGRDAACWRPAPASPPV